MPSTGSHGAALMGQGSTSAQSKAAPQSARSLTLQNFSRVMYRNVIINLLFYREKTQSCRSNAAL
jgi:hypothetical protein